MSARQVLANVASLPELARYGTVTPVDVEDLADFQAALKRELDASEIMIVEPCLGGALKRCFDFVAAALGLAVLAAPMMVLALLVMAQDGGSAFYGQKRLGYGGQSFRCWKFRSMRKDAGERFKKYLAEHPEAAAEWRQTHKLRRDPRVTLLGWVLRKTSLDELPQLFNVLCGEMSLVGPRPVVYDEFARYGRAMRHYIRCRPGLSGLWQVSGRSDTTYDERVELDRAYVLNWSFFGDISILVRTAPALLSSRGAY